ncbi:hypothetical protein TNCV_1392501 [Trichonephila clavipes]|nr:hypothetical protein TNCV_1392501 [Trichonephila clavipes]
MLEFIPGTMDQLIQDLLESIPRGGNSSEPGQPSSLFLPGHYQKLETFPFPPEEDENWDHNDIVRVPHDELEHFIKAHLVKDYLERENHGWDVVIGATDQATYMYLDRIIPEVMQYVGKEHHAETVVHDMMKRYRWREEDPVHE